MQTNATWRWALATFSLKDSLVGGSVQSFGTLTLLLPTLRCYALRRASVNDWQLDWWKQASMKCVACSATSAKVLLTSVSSKKLSLSQPNLKSLSAISLPMPKQYNTISPPLRPWAPSRSRIIKLCIHAAALMSRIVRSCTGETVRTMHDILTEIQ